MELTSVSGNSQKLDGGAMFGNAPKAMWQAWAPADEHNRIDLACRCLLVRDAARTILFEAGVGAFFAPHLRERYGVVDAEHVLLAELRALGVEAADVDVVVLSHLHFDHAGGVLTAWRPDRAPELCFPNATFVVGATAWQRARAPHPRDRASFVPELVDLLAHCGRLEVCDDRAEPVESRTLGNGFCFRVSHGHTPGMLCAEIPAPAGPVVFAADLVPGRAWVRRAITMGYDRFPELLIDEKQRLLDDLVERGGRLFYTHDPACAASGLRRDARGHVVPVDEVAELRSTG